MKKAIAVFLILTITFLFVGCGKTENVPTTTNGYIDSGVNNNSEDVNVDSFNNTTNSVPLSDDSVTQVYTTGTTPTQSQPDSTQSSSVNTVTSTVVSDETPSATEAKGITPDSVESSNGIQKAVYNTSERQYIVYYMSELLTHNSKFPIVSWANGTGCPPSLYDGLLRELAGAGFIVVASDETMAADGTAQIDAIDFIISESKNSVSALYKKVNTSKIGVIGHSQGGRSSVNAGASDNRITCVLSLAGSNYVEEAQKLSKPVLFMAGSKDKVVDPEKWLVTAYDAVKGPAVYASLNGAIHTTCCSNPTAYSKYAINWFNAWFYNDGNLKAMFMDGGELSGDSNWSDFMCKGL